MVIMVILFVPDMKSSSGGAGEEGFAESADLPKVPMGSKFWILLINYILFVICYLPLQVMASVYIAENGLGNEAFAGIAASAQTIGSCVCCLAFGFLFSRLKARTSLVSFVIMTLGLLVMRFLPDKAVFMTICVLCGGAYGMMFSYIYAQAPMIVAPQNISKAISYLTAGLGLAIFAGTYVVTGLEGIVGDHTLTGVCLVLGVVLAACTAVEFINTGRMMKDA